MPITIDSTGVPDNSEWRKNNTLWDIETIACEPLSDDDRDINLRLYEEATKPNLHCELRLYGSLLDTCEFSLLDTESMGVVDTIADMLADLT